MKTTINLAHYYSLIFCILFFPFIGEFYDDRKYAEISELVQSFAADSAMWEYGAIIAHVLFQLVVIAGLILRKEWGRKLFVVNFIFTFLIYILPGSPGWYYSGLGRIFSEIGMLAEGMLLLICLIPALYEPIFKRPQELYHIPELPEN